MADDVAAINHLRERETAAVKAGDVGTLLSLRTEDFVAMPPDQPVVRGTEAVRGFLQGMFDQIAWEGTFTSEDVVVAGDWAYDRGIFTGTATPNGDGEPMPLDGKYLWILKRQTGGSWRFAVVSWSSNQPPSGPH